MTVALRPLVAAALALGMLGLAIDAARADTTNVIGKYFDPQKRNVYTFILTVTGNDGSRRALVGFPIAPGRDPHVATFSTAAEWSRFVALWREAKAQPRSGVSANASMVASYY